MGGWEWGVFARSPAERPAPFTATRFPASPPGSGWISALVVLQANTAVAVLMLLVALFFTGIAVLGIVMLKRVRRCVPGGAGRVRSWAPGRGRVWVGGRPC